MSHPALENIRIVLVGTTHPGNIGAAARAMKTMQQSKLVLVAPKIYPSAEATARATGADDILAKAEVYDDLKTAVADCELVIATTARRRSLPWPTITPRQCAEQITQAGAGETAIVFGRESSGLSNEELELSHLMLQIPANPDYSSLNLASAVQIVCYELLVNALSGSEPDADLNAETYASQKQMEMFYEHLEQGMIEIGYLDPDNPRRLMHRMRRLFNRARLEESEWKILRGLLSAMQDRSGNMK